MQKDLVNLVRGILVIFLKNIDTRQDKWKIITYDCFMDLSCWEYQSVLRVDFVIMIMNKRAKKTHVIMLGPKPCHYMYATFQTLYSFLYIYIYVYPYVYVCISMYNFFVHDWAICIA